MQQIIMKDKRVVCVTTVPYPATVVKETKKAGYRVTEIKEPVAGADK